MTETNSQSARPAPSCGRSTERADYPQSKGVNSDRINLGRRKQEGTPKCQINLRNRKADRNSIFESNRCLC